MAQDVNDPVSLNVRGVRELIGKKTNKIQQGAAVAEEGPEGEELDNLSLDMSDEELLALKTKWEYAYEPYEGKIKTRQENNKKYYLGRQLEGTEYNVEFPIAANLLFEAEETFLPVALSRNPDPVVWPLNNSPEGSAIAKKVRTMLQYHAEQLCLREKMSLMTRHWSIYFIGIIKHGWDKEINDIKCEVRHPQNFVFDPEGYVDVYGDFEGYLGERITLTASELIDLFPDCEADIRESVKDKLGTEVVYTEWWTDQFCFSTYRDIVLDKHKNENYNYDSDEEDGDEVIKANNHFAHPKKPYTFLSVFSLGEQPHDITGLIEQNIPNQNLITKRTMQIDVNLSRQNNSVAFSADNFNQQTAKQAAGAFEKGNPVLVPSGRPIGEAIQRFPAESYPEAAFKELDTNKDNLRSSFGTQGVTAQQPNEETTARGMILNQQRDSSRIGGGIGAVLEQVAKNVFNHWVQLYYKYYDEAHQGSVQGIITGVEHAIISNAMLTHQLMITVANGSMAPKDEITQMNQAVQLFEMGVLDPKSLLTTLNVPDTENTVKNALLWMMNKQAYIQVNYPDLFQVMMGMMAPQGQSQGQAVPGQISPENAPTTGGEPPSASLSNVPLPK